MGHAGHEPYKPKPINTFGVELPEEVLKLGEVLAEHNHDVWAEGWIRTGWTWGESRDDVEKKHPCLVAYEDLPEGEKQFDRDTAVGVLKAILVLGYEIKKKD